MKRRNLKLIVADDGHKGYNYKLKLPKEWVEKTGITKDEKNIILTLDDDKFTIEKGEYKRFAVTKSFYYHNKGRDGYYCINGYYYNPEGEGATPEEMERFVSKEDAINYAKKLYIDLFDDLVKVQDRYLYYTLIDVLDYEDEYDPEIIETFGWPIIEDLAEEYEKYKELDEDIQNFIEQEDLDDLDKDTRKKVLLVFKNRLDDELLEHNQITLINFWRYIKIILKRQEKR